MWISKIAQLITAILATVVYSRVWSREDGDFPKIKWLLLAVLVFLWLQLLMLGANMGAAKYWNQLPANLRKVMTNGEVMRVLPSLLWVLSTACLWWIYAKVHLFVDYATSQLLLATCIFATIVLACGAMKMMHMRAH